MSTKIIKKRRQKIIRSTGEKVAHEIVFVFFVVYAITLVYPFLFLLMNSFKADINEMSEFPLRFPRSFSFMPYWEALQHRDFRIGEMFFNTITLTVGQTFVSMALTCMASYTLAKYRFRLNSPIYTTILISSVVPTFGAEASTFNLITNILHLNNNYLGMLLLCGGFGSSFLFLHSFFKEIPWSFAESAMLDGASDFRIFLQIMLPLAKNGIMVFTIMKFMGFWNEYWTPFLYYRAHPTLAVGLATLSKLAGQRIQYSVFFAGTIMCILPVIIGYAFFANKLMDNLNAGGIKG